MKNRGKVLFSEAFRGKSACCKSVEDLKALNIKHRLKLVCLVKLLFPGPGDRVLAVCQVFLVVQGKIELLRLFAFCNFWRTEGH